MRFAGFGVVNKLPAQFPRVKIAIIKRAYWKKPSVSKNCWCNNPENAWAAVAAPLLQCAEDLLLYVRDSKEIYNQIAPVSEKKDSSKRISFTQRLISCLLYTSDAADE